MESRRLTWTDSEEFWTELSAAVRDLVTEEGQELKLSTISDYTVESLTEDNAVLGKAEASKEAAYNVWPRTGVARWKVVAALFAEGPMTRKEIADYTGIKLKTVEPRCLEAMKGKFIRQCIDHPDDDGKEVLEITELGEQELEKDLR